MNESELKQVASEIVKNILNELLSKKKFRITSEDRDTGFLRHDMTLQIEEVKE